MYAYIDESGHRGRSRKASEHFILAAAVLPSNAQSKAADLLSQLRRELGRRPSDELSWKNLRSHSKRLHVARTLSQQSTWLTVSCIVVCKNVLPGKLNDDMSYLYTFRFLLERLSWLARDSRATMNYTLAHIQRFKIAKLREYETVLRQRDDTSIEWGYLDPKGGDMDQPSRKELLQLGDLAASACGAAFNADEYGNTERRYLQEMSPCLYRRGTSQSQLTSYGLKMHPWSESIRAAYPWVAAL